MSQTSHSPSGKAASDMLAAAVAYASRGWPVFPCEPGGKRPLVANGLHDATTDPLTIERWFTRVWPDANVAIRTGGELVVLDVDGDDGPDTLHELEREHGALPPTVEAITGSGGRHLYFAHAGEIRNSAGKLGPGLDVRGDGGYVVAPPSLHASGRTYTWSVDGDPDEIAVAQLPAWLVERLHKRPAVRLNASENGHIPQGRRNDELARLAGAMRRRGATKPELLAALTEANQRRCRPPLERSEVERVVASVARYEPDGEVAPPLAPDVPARTISEVRDTFARWLYLPDPVPLYAALGALAANYLPGDPVWLVLVGPPGGGKTEILQAAVALPDVYAAATLTEPALLSGTAKRERGATAKGGLLREIGDFGVILCKDLGSVLSMHHDARSTLLAALREVYDGSWTRHVGVDGGRTLHWSGKVGLLAGSTPTLDRHHAVMGSMGERFTLVRLLDVERTEQAHRSLAHVGQEGAMRAELSRAVAGLFTNGLPRQPRERTDADTNRLVSLATLVCACRSTVERDGYSREVELVPGTEAPTRLVKVLERLLAGLDATGLDRAGAWRVVTRAGLDSMPALRRAALDALYDTTDQLSTTNVAEAVGHPTQTTRRALEDLAAHGVLLREAGGQGKADRWRLTAWTRREYAHVLTVPETADAHHRVTFPETAPLPVSTSNNPHHTYDDKSGTPSPGGLHHLAQEIAELVLAMLHEPSPSDQLVDAATLARALGVARSYVYEHAAELGAIRLGEGARPRLRFDIDTARSRLDAPHHVPTAAALDAPSRRRRARRSQPDVPLLPIRPGRRAA